MAVNAELLAFVREALGKGMTRDQIRALLDQAGWPTDQVRAGLAAFAEVDSPVPVPSPGAYLSAREAFLYLVLFTTLYISAYNLGLLLFQFINLGFPDPAADPYLDSHDRIRWAISALVVAFPVFLFVSRHLREVLRRDPTLRGSRVRKWLTYLTLFGTACILIGDVIGLLYGFLGGELTVRFVLKVLVVAAIAGAIFVYYLWELRGDEQGSGA